MRRSHFLRNSVALFAFGYLCLGNGPVSALDLTFLNQDKSVCYKRTDLDRTWVLRLNVKKQGRLTTLKEKKKHDHPIQSTYSVHGKAVIEQTPGGGLVSQRVYGTVTVDDRAASMAIVRVALLSLAAGPTSLVDHFDCQVNEASATPTHWGCGGMSLIPGQVPQLFFVNSLERIDNPVEEPACSFSGLEE